jgi:hypothetical protein
MLATVRATGCNYGSCERALIPHQELVSGKNEAHTATDDLPRAIRAMSAFKTSWFGRRRRIFCYDALLADGRIVATRAATRCYKALAIQPTTPDDTNTPNAAIRRTGRCE